MYSGFQPTVEVTQPNLLFGHNYKNGILNTFVNKLKMGTNTQVIGERRIGKTSLMKCAIHQLRLEPNKYLPIYLNFRQHHAIRGYDKAHKLLLAYIHANVIQQIDDKIVSEALQQFPFDKCDDPNDVLDLLEIVSIHEVESYIRKYVDWLNKKGIGIVIFFDEYESMMTSTFEGQRGSFFFIRDLSSISSWIAHGPKPFTYVIAGSTNWNKLCDRFGSPEFNNTSEMIYVTPIDEDAFREMWEYCLSVTSEDRRSVIKDLVPDISIVYELTGGHPFFAKIIGDFIASESVFDEDEIYDKLSQHFSVSWDRMLDEKYYYIFLEDKRQSISTSNIRDLKKRGLIDQDQITQVISPHGKLWGRYIQEQIKNINPISYIVSIEDEQGKNIQLLGDEIINLVISINETCQNYKKPQIFAPTNSDHDIYKYLKIPAKNRVAFTHFATHMYLLLYERTSKKANDKSQKLGLLPKEFGRNHRFIKEVDAIRHTYGKAHLTNTEAWQPSSDAVPVAEVLEHYLGSKKSPDEHQFVDLQLALLKALRDYLNDLHGYVSQNSVTKK